MKKINVGFLHTFQEPKTAHVTSACLHQPSFHLRAGWKAAQAAASPLLSMCWPAGRWTVTGFTSHHLLAVSLAQPVSYLNAGLTNDRRVVYSPQAIHCPCPLQEFGISEIFMPLVNLFEQDSTVTWERWDETLRQVHADYHKVFCPSETWVRADDDDFSRAQQIKTTKLSSLSFLG